jgi:hypothetical protein
MANILCRFQEAQLASSDDDEDADGLGMGGFTMNLPPLPEYGHLMREIGGFTAAQMRAYAEAAVLAERERLMSYYDAQCAVELVRLRDSIPGKIEAAVLAERNRIIAMLNAQHEAAKHRHNLYACIAQELIREGADCHPPCDCAAMRTAVTAHVRQIEEWLETGIPAGPEESRAIYRKLKAAIGEPVA